MVVLAQYGFQILSGLALAFSLPRLMGPAIYGQYVLAVSLSLWFVLATSLGFTQIISRYVPPISGQPSRLRDFFGQLLSIRLPFAAGAALAYGLITCTWLRDEPAVGLLLIAASLGVRSVSECFYSLFLGLNRAATWNLGQVIRGWVSLILVILGFRWQGLVGAVAGLLICELLILCLGIFLAKPYIGWPKITRRPFELKGYIRFGLTFFIADLLLAAFRRSGEALIRVIDGNYAQVSFFSLAYDIFLTGAAFVPRIALAFVPVFTHLLQSDEHTLLTSWSDRLSTALVAGTGLVLLATLTTARYLVPIVFGSAYTPVIHNLPILISGLVPLGIAATARTLTIVHLRARLALEASALRLIVFWLLAPLMIARWESLGACLSALVAVLVYSVYLTRRIRRVDAYRFHRAWVAAFLLVPFLGLLWIPTVKLAQGLLLFLLASLAYGTAILAAGLVHPRELVSLAHHLLRGNKSW